MKTKELQELEELWNRLSKMEKKELELLIPATEEKCFYKALRHLIDGFFYLYEDCDEFTKTEFYEVLCKLMIRVSLVEEKDRYDFKHWCRTNGIQILFIILNLMGYLDLINIGIL